MARGKVTESYNDMFAAGERDVSTIIKIVTKFDYNDGDMNIDIVSHANHALNFFPFSFSFVIALVRGICQCLPDDAGICSWSSPAENGKPCRSIYRCTVVLRRLRKVRGGGRVCPADGSGIDWR